MLRSCLILLLGLTIGCTRVIRPYEPILVTSKCGSAISCYEKSLGLLAEAKAMWDNVRTQLSPPGTVLAFAGDEKTVIPGWLFCDGKELPQASYPDLYKVIGIRYGQSTDGKFKLPDMRGIFLKGAGITDRPEGRSSLGQPYSGQAVGTYNLDHFQGHRHMTRKAYSGGVGGSSSASPLRTDGTAANGEFIDEPIGAPGFGEARYATTTEPQSLSVNFIIKY